MAWLLLVLGLIMFIGLVVIHEFGHYLVARRNGIEAEEFGIGFPPRAKLLTKRQGTEFTLNWLPLGGFVKLKGEHDADTAKGTFGAASTWAKTKVMLAGVGMNLITAFLMLTILATLGMPKFLDHQFTVKSDTKILKQEVLVGAVEDKSPAAAAGLRAKDQLQSIQASGQAPISITSQPQLSRLTEQLSGQKVTVTIKRQEKIFQQEATLLTHQQVNASRQTNNPRGYLGVVVDVYVLQRSTWSAPIVALGFMKQTTVATYQGLETALRASFKGQGKEATDQLSGPVGIFRILKNGSFLGYQFILLVVALISLALAIMNLLPIPALDGGRLYFLLISRLIKKPLSAKTEDIINGIGFIIIMILAVIITYFDLKRP